MSLLARLNCGAAGAGLILLLAGCDPHLGLQDAVKAKLRDPFSAQFQSIHTGQDDYVCGEVNSKNGFGAYSGWTEFRARKVNGYWDVEWDDSGVDFIHAMFVRDCIHYPN